MSVCVAILTLAYSKHTLKVCSNSHLLVKLRTLSQVRLTYMNNEINVAGSLILLSHFNFYSFSFVDRIIPAIKHYCIMLTNSIIYTYRRNIFKVELNAQHIIIEVYMVLNSLSPKLNSVDFRVAGLAILRCK